ncbi:uncharacterized protein LOC132613322 [Lycium barbarum]|uniref:uncharacterized protein LOC132613322 n=1 Tax=Lycium barbarum TaxID=112863 RepID=UPI00293E2DB9|nr:uncharacterized protein LOC132613322 [Lycium barbarum]
MGKRTRIPTQKAIEAQEGGKKGDTQMKMKDNQKKLGAKGVNTAGTPSTVATMAIVGEESNEVELPSQLEIDEAIVVGSGETGAEATRETTTPPMKKVGSQTIMQEWEEAMQMSNNTGRQSWADEVDAAVEMRGKGSIWDNFDISKISNAGFKLDFVSPLKEGESHVCEIEIEDITSKIAYWRNAVVCYVLGAHPPFAVMRGYIQRQWGKHGINKISMMKNGIVLVRFDNLEGKNEVLQGGIYHFDNKPFIVKAWNEDMEFTREELYTVPIWVTFLGLDFKYWGPKGLSKIGSLIGKPLMADKNTEKKIGLNFARLLIEVDVDTPLPDKVYFRNEKGNIIE